MGNQTKSDFFQSGYGTQTWELYGRVGISDLKSRTPSALRRVGLGLPKMIFKTTGVLGTLGAKGFYPFNKAFGIGAFVQGSYYFTNFMMFLVF